MNQFFSQFERLTGIEILPCIANFLVLNKFGVNSVRIIYRFTPQIYQSFPGFLEIDSFYIFINSFAIVIQMSAPWIVWENQAR